MASPAQKCSRSRGGGSLWVGGAAMLNVRLAIVQMISVVGRLLPSQCLLHEADSSVSLLNTGELWAESSEFDDRAEFNAIHELFGSFSTNRICE
jgi:hypothetical protein